MSVRIKICGMTNLEDALLCADEGADALGFVFYPRSPRAVSPEAAQEIICQLPPFLTTVGVFVNETAERIAEIAAFCGLDAVQLHGDESPDFCDHMTRRVVKAFRMREGVEPPFAAYRADAFLLDAYLEGTPGGTGRRFDWTRARDAKRHGRIILAGGLTLDNLAEAIRVAQPDAVDVSSGVEAAPGKKDPSKVRAFCRHRT